MSVAPPEGPLEVPSGGFAVLHWDLRGQPAANVLGLHINPGGVVDQTTATEIATQIRAAFLAAGCASYQSAGTHLTDVGVRDLRVANMPEWRGVITPTVGTDNAEPLPISTALVVTLRTALAGKRYRGRVYLPLDGGGAWDGAAQAYVTPASQSGTSFIGNIRTNLANSAILSGNFQLAVISRWYKLSTLVTGQQVRSSINGTQRGRMPKRG